MGLQAIFGAPGFFANQGAGPPVSIIGQTPTYSSGIINFTPFSTAPTDICQLLGSATKTVKLTRLHMWFTDSSAVNTILPVQLLKRSTAGTFAGVTVTAASIVPHDTNDAAATAVFNTFTVANPTTGTLTGIVRAGLLQNTLATQTATDFPAGSPIIWDFGSNGEKLPTIRGVAQQLVLNLAGATIVGTQSLNIALTWLEDNS